MFTSIELIINRCLNERWKQTPETMKLFGYTKKIINKTKHRQKVQSVDLVEVVLVPCNLVDNRYQ